MTRGKTVLMHAVQSTKCEVGVSSKLVQSGADVNRRDVSEKLPYCMPLSDVPISLLMLCYEQEPVLTFRIRTGIHH